MIAVLPSYKKHPLPVIAWVILMVFFSGCGRSVRQQQYLVQGSRIYTGYCSNCHQADGSGLAALFPPLASSDWLKDRPDEVICAIRNGLSGPVTVNGVLYDQPMPANPDLTDLEIAELMTWMRTEWAGDTAVYSAANVRQVLDNCASNR